MADELADRTSPVFKHRAVLKRVRMGFDPRGRKAWVGTYADRTDGRRVCVWVSGEQHAFGANIEIGIGDCRSPTATTPAA
jgi:hypothetical protein